MKYHSHHIISRVHMTDRSYCLDLMFVRFRHHKVTLIFLPFHTSGMRSYVYYLLHKLFVILLCRSFIIPHIFIHPFIYMSMVSCIFYTLDYNVILLYLIFIQRSSFDHWSSFSWVLYPSDRTPSLYMCVCFVCTWCVVWCTSDFLTFYHSRML